MARTYDSPLRERQAAATHDRIVEAYVELMVAEPTVPPTMAGVADQADVSLRTVYRHFPAREDLIRAVGEQVRSSLGVYGAEPPSSSAELRAAIRSVSTAVLADEPLHRAKLLSPDAPAARRDDAQRRLRWIREAIATETKGCDDWQRRRLVALLRVLCGTGAFFELLDVAELDADEASDALDWAIEHLVADTIADD